MTCFLFLKICLLLLSEKRHFLCKKNSTAQNPPTTTAFAETVNFLRKNFIPNDNRAKSVILANSSEFLFQLPTHNLPAHMTRLSLFLTNRVAMHSEAVGNVITRKMRIGKLLYKYLRTSVMFDS